MDPSKRYIRYNDLNQGRGILNSPIYRSLKSLFEPIIMKEFKWFPTGQFDFKDAYNVKGTNNLELEFEVGDNVLDDGGFLQVYDMNKDSIISGINESISEINYNDLVSNGLSPGRYSIRVMDVKSIANVYRGNRSVYVNIIVNIEDVSQSILNRFRMLCGSDKLDSITQLHQWATELDIKYYTNPTKGRLCSDIAEHFNI